MKDKYNNEVGPAPEKRARKIRLFAPTVGGLSLLGGLQLATQSLPYLHQFGKFGVDTIHWHEPWKILEWAYHHYDEYPNEFITAGSVGMVPLYVAILTIIIEQRLSKNSSTAHQTLHGSARKAVRKDIEDAGLIAREPGFFGKCIGKRQKHQTGVYVGKWNDEYLRHNGPEHVMVIAPTRSGKGVGLVIPTLLSWQDSAVITDLKGELWALTAGYRQKHANNAVIRFEPADRQSAHWNPLQEVRIGTDYEVGDAQNIATLIVDPDGKGLKDHWQKTAQALLVGVILHAIYKNKAASLPDVDFMLADPSRGIKQLWTEMQEKGTHPIVAMAAQDMIDRPDEEAGSVLSTAKSYLALYRDPVVQANVKDSSFRIKDLMGEKEEGKDKKQPVSLYIVTQPTDKDRLKPLVRLMINMIIRVLADKMEFKKGKAVSKYQNRLLLMMDEFPSLGKLDILQESLAFLAGYGIKCYLICQDINQIKSRETGYGQDESITSNCHVQIAYAPNRLETAEFLSKKTGTTTVIKEQITTSGKRAGLFQDQASSTIQEVSRPLFTPDEIMTLPGMKTNADGEVVPGSMLVFVAGYPVIEGTQPLYFKEPYFLKMSQIDAPTKTDKTVLTIENRDSLSAANQPVDKQDQDEPPEADSSGRSEKRINWGRS